jgi:RimJ/RimL family protein N-acetyltransferase
MLQGQEVTLRETREMDLPVLASIRNDMVLQLALMATPRPNTAERVEDWIKRRANDPAGVFFVVALAEGGQPIGFVQLVNVDAIHQHADLGICILPDYQGGGRALVSLQLLERYARSTLGLRKIVLRVLALNSRAIAFYEKSGYRQVGILQAHHFQSGEFHDVLLMEKLLEATAT